MEYIQLVRIAESLRTQNMITKMQNVSKVAGSRNDCQMSQLTSLALFTFNAVEFQAVTINGKPWICARKVCRTLLSNIRTTSSISIKWEVCMQNGHLWSGPMIPTKKSFHHSGGIPVEFHWSHGKLLEKDWNKWNL